MGIHVNRQTAKLIEEELQSGRFQDAASLVDAALRYYLLECDLDEAYSREQVEANIERGIVSLERGDGERFMNDLMARFSESSASNK